MPELSAVHIEGYVELSAYKNGLLVARECGHNLVVNSGLTLMLSQLVGAVTAVRPYLPQDHIVQYLALGNNRTGVIGSNTTLGSEDGIRKLAYVTSPSTGNFSFTATWSEAENVNTSIGEIGLFTNATSAPEAKPSGANVSDTMFSRYVLQNAIPKDQFTQFVAVYLVTVTAL